MTSISWRGISSKFYPGSGGKLRVFFSNCSLGGGAYELPVCQIPTLPPPWPLWGVVRLDNDRRIILSNMSYLCNLRD